MLNLNQFWMRFAFNPSIDQNSVTLIFKITNEFIYWLNMGTVGDNVTEKYKI